MTIIAYTYDADYHCVGCAKKRFGANAGGSKLDEHGVPEIAHDMELNPIHPVFDTDELPTHLLNTDGGQPMISCGTCRNEIERRDRALNSEDENRVIDGQDAADGQAMAEWDDPTCAPWFHGCAS